MFVFVRVFSYIQMESYEVMLEAIFFILFLSYSDLDLFISFSWLVAPSDLQEKRMKKKNSRYSY